METNLAHEHTSSSDQPKAVILLVEDHDELRTVLTKLLERSGYEVIAKPDPMAAARHLIRDPRRPDLLITSLWLPGQSSLQFLTTFKRIFRDVPVIVTSTIADAAMVAEAVQCGAFLFLCKPVDRVALLASVKLVLALHQHHQATMSDPKISKEAA